MKFIKLISYSFLITSLVSCTYPTTFVQQRDKEYLKATSLPPLRQPPGINLHTIHSNYAVAEKSFSASSKEVSLIPPGL